MLELKPGARGSGQPKVDSLKITLEAFLSDFTGEDLLIISGAGLPGSFFELLGWML